MSVTSEDVKASSAANYVSPRSPLSPLPRPDRRLHGSRVKTTVGVIKSVRYLTYDTIELIVKTDEGCPPLNAKAGQYATLQTEGLEKPRSYSFARAPSKEAPNEYTFFVRMVHGGAFSGWLFGRDRTGASITISGPLGRFGLDSSNQCIVAIAGGSGMSAIKAMLEEAAASKVKRDCLFLYGARTQRDLYCAEEIADIKKNWHPSHKFEHVNVLSNEPAGTGWSGATGFVTDYLRQQYLQTGKLNVNNMQVYFCGPPPMVDAGLDVLKTIGLPGSAVHFDKFEDAKSPAPVISNSLCVLCDECLLVKPVANCIVEVAKLKGSQKDGILGYERVDPAYTSGIYYNTLFIDDKECIRCYACVDACPVGAISPQFEKVPNTLRRTVTEN